MKMEETLMRKPTFWEILFGKEGKWKLGKSGANNEVL